MKLYLVQHGEACTKEVDIERPLTEHGKTDVDKIANFLKQMGISVERVIHSGKLRAQQTAECLAAAIAPTVELEISDLINPNDNPNAFDWQREYRSGDTLIVGHLPFMAKLVSLLVVEDENQSIIAYEPGSMVCLEFTEEKYWQIDWMLRPELFS